MGVMDFLMGRPASVESDPRTKAARDFILDELMRIYGQGPINIPKYIAEVPEQRYSGTNNLLSALGLDTVSPPQMDTVNIGGINAYSSEPFQEQIEADFAEKYPSLYEQLINRTNPAMTASLQPVPRGGGGGGSNSGGVGAQREKFFADHMARQKMNFAKAAQEAGDNILNYGQDSKGGVYACLLYTSPSPRDT